MSNVCVTSFYVDPDCRRKREIEYSLQNNVGNVFFDKVLVWAESDPRDHLDIDESRVVVVRQESRPTFSELMDLLRNEGSNLGVNVVMNSDCFISGSGRGAFRHLTEKRVFCMTRWEMLSIAPPTVNYRLTAKYRRRYGFHMQDAWAFRGRPVQVGNCDFYMGRRGCDNRFCAELERAGYEIRDPFPAVQLMHAHVSGLTRHTAADAVPEPYAYPTPIGWRAQVSKLLGGFPV